MSLGVQYQPELCTEFQASLGYMGETVPQIKKHINIRLKKKQNLEAWTRMV
jgi:hypothetical protein